MPDPLVSCLMATHGRHSRVCESLSCFLSQTYENRELVILNEHPASYLDDAQSQLSSLLDNGPWRERRHRRGGVYLLRADAMRDAIFRGVDVMEAEVKKR